MTDLATAETLDEAPRSRLRDGFARLRRNHAALAGLIVVPLIVLACVVLPWALPFAPNDQDYDSILLPPLTGGHLFGTDELGRDLLVRILVAGRISLSIAFAATLIALVIGTAYGAIAGYFGGLVDHVMMRFVDVLYGLPFLIFVMMLTVVLGRGLQAIFFAIAAVLWLTVAAIARSQALSLKQKEFVEAARACGMRRGMIVWRHVVPNAVGPVIVYASLLVPNVILSESLLSYLGLGVQEPQTSWGLLISQATDSMETAPWLVIFPSIFLAATLFSLNFVADGLRDAFDPKDR